MLSNCCQATIYPDTDICSCCKEHCGAICPECDGEGQVENFVYTRHNVPFGGLTDIIEWKTCDKCNGEGYIEVDL